MNKNKSSPTRKSPRLPEYDYALAGGYFITIVTHDREMLFGDVVDGKMKLNEVGEIVRNCWFEIPKHFSYVSLDEFIIMPNHIHGIIFIHKKDDVGEGHAPPEVIQTKRATHASPLQAKSGSLSTVVGSFKSAASKQINKYWKTTGNPINPIWQRSYYDRIIRDDKELHNLREYTRYNIFKWLEDEENPDYGIRP